MAKVARKIANKDTKSEVRQYCIDAATFDEVVDAIPKKVKIERMYVRIGTPFAKRDKLNVPTKEEKLGVLYVSIPKSTAKEIIIKFEGISRNTMSENLDKICKIHKMDRKEALVRNMTVECEGVTGYFMATTKSIHPDNTDQRKKLKVMGLTETEKVKGASLSKLIRNLSLARYSCQFESITVQRIMCSKLK